ncbi:MAG: DUF2652 domain-containing protein [Flavobacteriales bacterium]|nr:DUF2652 domain-containing protein [Flavobacteriales bacterium]
MAKKKVNFQNASIFLPDISGFTNFQSSVEIEHSTHIISELLEILIKTNRLNFKVSEIEGDAILFYRLGDPPSFREMNEQVEEMFMEFHRHLYLYKRDRICQCGACCNAELLDLKFILHSGEIALNSIGKHQKIIGPDVTAAHRLLKNDVMNDSYFLLSEHVYSSTDFELFNKGSNEYEGIGEINYVWKDLSELKSKIPELPARKIKIEEYKNSVSLLTSADITAPLLKVHQYVTDVELKPKWSFGLRAIGDYEKGPQKIGSKHACILQAGTVDFEILNQRVSEGLIEYVETSNGIKILGPTNTYFIMKKVDDNNTQLTVNIRYQRSTFTNLLLDLPFRIFIKASMKKSLVNLKKLIETS